MLALPLITVAPNGAKRTRTVPEWTACAFGSLAASNEAGVATIHKIASAMNAQAVSRQGSRHV